jgi:hypothetical protein
MLVAIKEYSKRDFTYPCLKIFPDDTIVLFISSQCGTVVSSGTSENPIGYYSMEWCENDTVLYHGRLVLENK